MADFAGKKTAVPGSRQRQQMCCRCIQGLTAAGTAGALHAGQNKSLSFIEIDVRIRKHHVRTLFQEHLQTVHLERGITPQGFLGYVHSQ